MRGIGEESPRSGGFQVREAAGMGGLEGHLDPGVDIAKETHCKMTSGKFAPASGREALPVKTEQKIPVFASLPLPLLHTHTHTHTHTSQLLFIK